LDREAAFRRFNPYAPFIPIASLRGNLPLSNKSLSNRQLAEGLVSALAEYNAGKELKLKAWSEYRTG